MQLKKIFQEASGDLLLGLCMLLDVSWQIMIDDKITQFVDLCCDYSRLSYISSQPLLLESLPTGERLFQQDPRNQMSNENRILNRIVSWFENERSSHADVDCNWLDASGVVQSASVNFFEVFLNLASIPKPTLCNMASKLSIQLHSFPKTLFSYLQKSEILSQEDDLLFKQIGKKFQSLVCAL
jgi:hypothetical protein